MKKYILKDSGREVNLGDKLLFTVKLFGTKVPVDEVIINEEILQNLISLGIVEESEYDIDINDVIVHLAGRIKWSPSNLSKYLNNLYRINPPSVLNILLKEVSIIFDKKYKGYIGNSEEIWIVNSFNLKADKAPKSEIKSYKGFAAFRNKEDVLKAKEILMPVFESIYGKQED